MTKGIFSPWRVVIDLNQSCNLKCRYCHIAANFLNHNQESMSFSPVVFNRLVEECESNWVFDLTLTGGEITTIPRFEEYLEIIPYTNFTSVQLITNGTLLSKRLCQKLASSGVKRISISLDGSQEINDRFRGKGTFRAAMRGIQNALSVGLRVNVISVITGVAPLGWTSLSYELKEIGVRTHNLSIVCRLGRAESDESWIGVSETDLDLIKFHYNEISSKLSDSTFCITLNDGVTKQPGFSNNSTPIHQFQDANPGLQAVVKLDGSIKANRILSEKILGNIHKDNLQTIWGPLSEVRARSGIDGIASLETAPWNYHYLEAKHIDISKLNRTKNFGHVFNGIAKSTTRIRTESWGQVSFDTETYCVAAVQ